MLRKIFQSASVFTLLLVFLAGSTGITFSAHLCGSTGSRQVTAFPEIFQKESSCCCDGSIPVMPAAASLDNESCCRTVHGFIKADFTGFPVQAMKLIKVLPSLAGQAALPFVKETLNPDPAACFVPCRDPSPPPGGKALVLAIHQQKIPSTGSFGS